MSSGGDGPGGDFLQEQLRLCFATLQQIASNLASSQPSTRVSSTSMTVASGGAPSNTATNAAITTPTTVTMTTPSTVSLPSSNAGVIQPLAMRWRVLDEHSNVFRNPTRHSRVPLSYPYRRPTRAQIWSHNFLCLASRYSQQVPSRQEKEELKEAGLGEQRVNIGLRASAGQLHEKLISVFPKLDGAGGYELLRCLPNSRSLAKLQTPQGGHTPESLKQDVGQARIYIRPLQRDLNTNPQVSTSQQQSNQDSDVMTSGVTEKCLMCGDDVPLERLSRHLERCIQEHSSHDDDNDFELTPPFISSRSTSTTTDMQGHTTPQISSPATLHFNAIASTCAYAIAATNNSSPTTVVVSSSVPMQSSISSEPGPSSRPSFTRRGGSKSSVGQMPTLSTSQSLPTSSGSSTNAGTIPLIPTPTYYELSESDEDQSPVDSPLHHSALRDMFPQLDSGQEALLLELYNNNVHEVIEALLDGVNSSTLLRRFQTLRMIPGVQHIEVRPDHVVEDGPRCLYKGSFNVSQEVEVEFVGTLTTDLGGPKRQFFTQFLQQMPTKLHLVEENNGVLFFTCNTESLLGNHYSRLGQVIVHSILQGGPAFPCLPKAVYYYLIGGIELAISHLSVDELPLEVQFIVRKVILAETEQELVEIRSKEEYLTVSSGVLVLLTMATREYIIQQIMLNQVICFRKAAIDQFLDGLCSLRFNELIINFPKEMEPLFLAALDSTPTNEELIAMLKLSGTPTAPEEATFLMLKDYIRSLSSKDCGMFLQFCTGAISVPPIGFSSGNPFIMVSVSSESAIQACTCFSSLKIPQFESYDLLASSFNGVIFSNEFNTM